MKEITDDELLRLYRHTKSSLVLMEAMLMNRGVIRCPKCGGHHGTNQPHILSKEFERARDDFRFITGITKVSA